MNLAAVLAASRNVSAAETLGNEWFEQNEVWGAKMNDHFFLLVRAAAQERTVRGARCETERDRPRLGRTGWRQAWRASGPANCAAG
jgi:hypothetical protein